MSNGWAVVKRELIQLSGFRMRSSPYLSLQVSMHTLQLVLADASRGAPAFLDFKFWTSQAADCSHVDQRVLMYQEPSTR
jgi:hypothetical protein